MRYLLDEIRRKKDRSENDEKRVNGGCIAAAQGSPQMTWAVLSRSPLREPRFGPSRSGAK